MNSESNHSNGRLARARSTVKWFTVSLILVTAILTAGLAIVALLSQHGSTAMWIRWSNIGQAFGALNSVVAGFALVALVVTFLAQLQEFRAQRAELAVQRESLRLAQSDLHRGTEAELRKLHVDLLKMAMNDSQLAAVWPALKPGLSRERNRQYLYANLILQHAWLMVRISDYTEAEMQSNLRYLFTSPLMREYWQASARNRSAILVSGTDEYRFAEVADEICAEYQAVLACMNQCPIDPDDAPVAEAA
jgi:hypothetical protein